MAQMVKMVENSFDRSSIETHDDPDGSKWSKMVENSFGRSSIETQVQMGYSKSKTVKNNSKLIF